MFPVKLAEFLRKPFLTEHLRWLLLQFKILQYHWTKYDPAVFSEMLGSACSFSGNSKGIIDLVRTQNFNFIKKKLHKLQHKCFPVSFTKFLKITILKNFYDSLLLIVALASQINSVRDARLNSKYASGERIILLQN